MQNVVHGAVRATVATRLSALFAKEPKLSYDELEMDWMIRIWLEHLGLIPGIGQFEWVINTPILKGDLHFTNRAQTRFEALGYRVKVEDFTAEGTEAQQPMVKFVITWPKPVEEQATSATASLQADPEASLSHAG